MIYQAGSSSLVLVPFTSLSRLYFALYVRYRCPFTLLA